MFEVFHFFFGYHYIIFFNFKSSCDIVESLFVLDGFPCNKRLFWSSFDSRFHCYPNMITFSIQIMFIV